MKEAELLEPTTIGPLAPAELLQQGAVILRIENDSLMAAAVQRPRDPVKCLARALRELEMDPDEAHDARYSLPFKDRSEGEGDAVTRVEGLSINAAMALARNWGNCSATARVLTEDESGFHVTGVFIDYETMFRVERPMRVSKLQVTKGGKRTYVMDARRQLTALQAGASKAMRNAILAGLPSGMKNPYERKAIAIASGGDPDAKANDEVLNKVVSAFRQRWDVGIAELEVYLGRVHHYADTDAPMPSTEWRGRHVADLRALFTALRDGQIKREEAFVRPESGTRIEPTELSPEALINATVTATNDAPRPQSTTTPPAPTQGGGAPAQTNLSDF